MDHTNDQLPSDIQAEQVQAIAKANAATTDAEKTAAAASLRKVLGKIREFQLSRAIDKSMRAAPLGSGIGVFDAFRERAGIGDPVAKNTPVSLAPALEARLEELLGAVKKLENDTVARFGRVGK